MKEFYIVGGEKKPKFGKKTKYECTSLCCNTGALSNRTS